jgi:hypothetical protein
MQNVGAYVGLFIYKKERKKKERNPYKEGKLKDIGSHGVYI